MIQTSLVISVRYRLFYVLATVVVRDFWCRISPCLPPPKKKEAWAIAFACQAAAAPSPNIAGYASGYQQAVLHVSKATRSCVVNSIYLCTCSYQRAAGSCGWRTASPRKLHSCGTVMHWLHF